MEKTALTSKKKLADLRKAACEYIPPDASLKEKILNVTHRAEAVRLYALLRANGTCEGCHSKAPFLTRKGTPFLEVHHVLRLADGGPDHPENVIALCPNCHRRAHYAEDAGAFNNELIIWLSEIENEL